MEFQVEAARYRIVPPDNDDRTRAREALAALAHPRMTGTEGAAEVGAVLRERFEKLGYTIGELPFSFSAWPGRFGVSAAGLLFLIGCAVALPLLWTGYVLGALIALVVSMALIGAVVRYAPGAVRKLRWGRLESANWLFHRPGARPRYLIVAHRDTKSQPISTLWRTIAIFGAIVSWVALLLLSIAMLINPDLHPVIPLFVIGWIALTSGVLLMLCYVGNYSPGALDNATGLAAMLSVAEREQENDDVAFLVTDAEELMLAGAYAVARQIPPVDGVINIDILDDTGDFHVAERFGLRRRGLAPHLVAALLSSADALKMDARRHNVPIGVMVDHMAFADAGLPAVTLNRSTLGTFRKVHRPGDDLHGVTGEGAAAGAAVISGALEMLRGSAPGA